MEATKKKRGRKVSLVTWGLILLCGLILGRFYFVLSNWHFLERSSNLSQVADEIGENLTLRMEYQWRQVENAVRAINAPDLTFSIQQIELLLGYPEGSILVIDDQGNCYRSSGERTPWLAPAMLEETAPEHQVLITEVDQESGKSCIFFLRRFTEPFLEESGRRVTHLALVDDMDRFCSDVLLYDKLGNSGGAYIVTEVGEALYYQDGGSDLGPADQVFNHLEDARFLHGSSLERMMGSIECGVSGTEEIRYQRHRWLISYHNLERNGWYILQIIPSSTMEGRAMNYSTTVLFYILALAVTIAAMVFNTIFSTARAKLRQEQAEKAAMEALAEEANRASEAKTVFLSNVSHDIRTPINGIIGMTAIARKHVDDPVKIRDCLNKVSVASEHLLALVNDTLDMTQIESGKTTIAHRPFNLRTLLDNCATLINNQLESRDVKFICDYDGLAHTHLLGDEVHVRQILINILGNSVKFTPDGGEIALRVTEETCQDGRAAYRIICSDTGIGMSQDFQKRLFLPFEQEDGGARTTHKGTGLGMSIAHHLTELMGGAMEVWSQMNVGTTFTLRLTFALDEDASASQEEAREADLTGMRVLLAEDNETNREIAEELLSDEGVVVTAVANGREALDAFRDHGPGTFDAILMDVMMPEMNGLEAAKAIRALPRPDAATIPILAMTANAYEEDRRKTRDAGMDEHLSKPLNLRVLLENLARYRDGSNQIKKNR